MRMSEKSRSPYKGFTTFNRPVDTGIVNNEPSMTRPDMAMSIRELMVRFSGGQPVDVTQLPYTGDQLLPRPGLDLVDIQELRDRNNQELHRVKAEFEKQRKSREALAKQRIDEMDRRFQNIDRLLEEREITDKLRDKSKGE